MKLQHFLFLITLLTICFSCNKLKDKVQENKTTQNKDSLVGSTDTLSKNIISDSLLYELEKLPSDSGLTTASIGYMIYNDSTNQVIAQKNASICLVPASVMKLVSTGAALEILGEGRRFRTTLQYDGKLEDGHILKGNIYIKGGGDPTLLSKFFKGYNTGLFDTWAEAIINMGIDSISGAVISDAQIFDYEVVPPTWEWGEIGSDYGAAAFGLTVYDNRFELKVNRNRRGIYKATATNSSPLLPFMSFENRIKVIPGCKETLYFVGAPYSDYKVVKGSVPGGSNFTLEGAIPDPPYLASYELEQALRKKGVKVSDSATTIRMLKLRNQFKSNGKRKDVASVYSPTVAAIVGVTNSRSNNLYAEHLLKHIGLARVKCGDTDAGAKAALAFWNSKGIDVTGIFIGDGSGISRHNTVSPKNLVDILKYMKDSSRCFTTFYNSLAIAGKKGTLYRMCKGSMAQGNLRAKSGSMTRVKSYAGYVTTAAGEDLIFSFIINNYNCSSLDIRKKLERIMILMAERGKKEMVACK